MATIGDAVPAGELREDIPLRSGAKSSRLCSCDEDSFGGSRFINISFAVLSVVITVALLVQIYYGDYQVTPHGSVATDSRECSAIGTSILKNGGNAADAAIASALCLAVVNPHVTGLDGTGQMLFYNHKTQLNPVSIDFSNIKHDSAILPRLIIGLAYVHKQHSKLSWKSLVQPSVDLAKKGFLVSRALASSLLDFPSLNLFGVPLEAGNKLTLNVLGEYLENIGNISETGLYKYISSMNQQIELPAVVSNFKNYNVYVPGTTAIGLSLLHNLQYLDNLNFTATDTVKLSYVHKIVEVTIDAYNELNIMKNFYTGTSSNIAVMDLNDNYVSLVTGMSSPFGTGQMSIGGYLLDINYSQKLPSRIPLIITDRNIICGRRIVLGASDIATASQIITSLLIADRNATSSVEAPRFHILNNGAIGIEEGHTPSYSPDVLNDLKTLVNGNIEYVKEPHSGCNVVEKYGDLLNSHSDSRGGGIASRF